MKTRHCPNSRCRGQIAGRETDRNRRIVRNGHYETAAHGRVQRYRCLLCGRGFSDQTFSLDYATKRKVSYQSILEFLISCAGIRSIARTLAVSHELIMNRISRLARQSLSVHADIGQSIRLFEPLVADGFESFVASQHTPNNIHLLAGKKS